MWIEATTVGDLVDRAAEESDGDAIVFPDVRVTYPELAELSARYARSLRALGVGPGEKVGILMPNQLEFVAGFVGAAKLGAIPVPINGRFKAHELAHVIAHADVRVLLTAAGPEGTVDYPALIEEVFPGLPAGDARRLSLPDAPELRQVVGFGADRPGFLPRAEFEAGADSVSDEEQRTLQERVRIRDIAMLMYTSGTTAKPKGCLLTHEAIVRHGFNVSGNRFFLTREDAFWDPLPLFHIGGIVPMLGCISRRCKFVHAGHFDPEVALRMMEEERCTVAYPAFDLIWLAVLDHPNYARTDLSRMRLVQSITTPERLRQLQERMPQASIGTSFGGTELSSNLTLPMPDDPLEVRLNTLGRTVPGMEMKIVDPETGEERPTGEIGELCARGYARFEAYYKDPEQTAKAIDAEGWFHTGDLASVDENGRLRYSGRLKDMLKVGGENVASIEIEDYLVGHPAVNIAQVVGAPDARYEEVPAAFVQLAPGATATEQELIEFCVGKIATFKVPRYVRFVEDWPMSGTKIQKFVLREQIGRELEEQGIAEAPKLASSERPVSA
jgi:fatty-acyl-CoA synthase